jgi:7-cyano-7-deazaguanine synthase
MSDASPEVCTVSRDSGNSGPTIVLLSGGVDSVTMLYQLQRQTRVVALFVDYAQRASAREHEVARYHATALGVELVRLDLTEAGKTFRDGQTAKLHIPLPHRNVVVLSLALSYAGQIRSPEIATAVIADDVGGYASASSKFLDAMRHVARELGGVTLSTPLIHLPKTRVIHLGQTLGVDFTQTHSCMRDNHVHCGRCTQCVKRRNSFREAGVVEPDDFYASAHAANA